MNLRKTFSMISFFFVVAVSVIGVARSASADEIAHTLNTLYRHAPGADRLFKRAAGVLVFPTIVKAGMGIGGEYGEGDLLIGGRPVGHYNTASASIGFQLGAEARSVVIMFMTPESLELFQRVDGFKVGVDGSVAILNIGAGASLDTENVTSPVIGFILEPKGLMYNLTLEGSKISRMR